MGLILSLETGTEICSVALAKDGSMISLRETTGNRAHANNLGIYIDEVLRENDMDAEELDAVAVGAGPGSYTGLRIGVSTAKGICYGLGKPLIAIDSLRSLANIVLEEYGAGIVEIDDPSTAILAPMIDARRMEVYTRLFDLSLRPLTETEAHILHPESFAEYRCAGREILAFGNGAEKCREILPDVRIIRALSSARGMVVLAEAAFREQHFADTAYFEPFYLKDFVATTSNRDRFGLKKES